MQSQAGILVTPVMLQFLIFCLNCCVLSRESIFPLLTQLTKKKKKRAYFPRSKAFYHRHRRYHLSFKLYCREVLCKAFVKLYGGERQGRFLMFNFCLANKASDCDRLSGFQYIL